jgi:hypothetical protein
VLGGGGRTRGEFVGIYATNSPFEQPMSGNVPQGTTSVGFGAIYATNSTSVRAPTPEDDDPPPTAAHSLPSMMQ